MTVRADEQRLWAAPNRPVVASMLALMTFIAIESFAITTVLPVVAADLDATGWYSFAFAATVTTGLVGMVVGGSWADRSGITPPLLSGGALFLVGIGLCVVAQDMSMFIVGRLLQGVGGGIDSVLVYVIIARHIPEPLRPRMFGLMAAAWLLPSMAGPLLAGTLTEVVHWRVVFALVLAGSSVALAVLVTVTHTPERPTTSGGESVLGRRARCAVAAALCLVIVHVGGQAQQPSGTAVLVAASIPLVWFGSRLLPAGTLRARPGVPALIATRGLLGAAVAATDVYLPLYLQSERDYTPSAAGLVIAIGALGWALGAWLQGRQITTDASQTRVIRRATLLVICGPLLAIAFMADLTPVAGVVVGCVLMGTGMGLAYPRISASVIARSTPEQQGQNSSALQASESMSTSAFLAMTGAVLTGISGLTGYVTVYALAAIVATVAAGVSGRAAHVHPVRGRG